MSSRIVVDASVALKWFFDDEEDLEPARRLFQQWGRRELELVVPPLWILEVLNAIRSRIVKKRVTPERAQEIANDFLEMKIVPTDVTAYAAVIYKTAVELERSAYDAAYVVLAENSGLEFVTADKRLFNAVSEKKTFVRYVTGYGAPPQQPESDQPLDTTG